MKICRLKWAILAISVLLLESIPSCGEAITADAIDSFKISNFDPQVVRKISYRDLKALSKAPLMPPKLMDVVPLAAQNNAKKPGGVLPVSIDPKTKEVIVLLGYERGNVSGFGDFGGSSDATDISREHTAVREFNEETCLAFWSDVSKEKLNPSVLSGSALEKAAKKPVTENVYSLFYAAKNKYYICLVPVSYQSVSQIQAKVKLVRSKVSDSPFFEKTDFVWIPLKTLIDWVEQNIENPKILGRPGKNISWRFFGGRVSDFTGLQQGHKGLQGIYNKTMEYLKKILELNKN